MSVENRQYLSVESILDCYKLINRKKVEAQLTNVKEQIIKVQASAKWVIKELDLRLYDDKANRNKELRDNIRAELTNIDTLFENIDQPFSIFIVGSGKFGKSTLLNALLGQQMVEVDRLPKTWKIDIFKKDEQTNIAMVRYKDGRVERKTRSETVELLDREEQLADKAKEESEKLYRQEAKRYEGNRKALRELKKDIEKKCLYNSDILEVIWSCNGGELLNNFQLVDTPGLNQELLDGELKPAFDDYYNKADGVLWLLDATKIAAKTVYDILNDSGYITDKNVIGVINKIDRIGEINSQNVQSVINQTNEIYKDKFSAIVPLSALNAFEGIVASDNAKLESSGYTRLVKEINNLFLKKGIEIRYERKVEGLKEYTLKIRKHIDAYRKQLNQDIRKYNELKRGFYADLDSLEETIDNIILNELNRYGERISNNINEYTENIFDFEEEEKAAMELYVKETIFEEKLLNKTITSIVKKIQKECTGVFDYWKNTSYIKEYDYIEPITYNVSNNAIIKMDSQNKYGDIDFTFGGTEVLTGFATIGTALLLLGPIGLVAAYFAEKSGFISWVAKGIAKMTKTSKIQEEFIREANKLLDQSYERIWKEASPMIGQLVETIDSIRDKSFSRLYYDYGDIGDIKEILSRLDSIEIIDLPEVGLRDIIRGDYSGYKQAN